jgi:hypothetical protein
VSDHASHQQFDPRCPDCNQEAVEAGFRGQVAQEGATVTCPNCGTRFLPPEPPIRVTESVDASAPPAAGPGVELAELEAQLTEAEQAAEAAAKQKATKPYGDVEYADPGYLDGAGTQASDSGLTPVARYALNTAKRVRAAWSYINMPRNQKGYTASQLKLIKGRIKAAAAKFNITIAGAGKASEAMVDGTRSFDDVRELVRAALVEREREESGEFYAYCYVADLTTDQVVYACGSKDELYQCAYEVDEAGEVTLGEPQQVVRTYAPAPAAMQTGEAAQPAEGEGSQDEPKATPEPKAPAAAEAAPADAAAVAAGRLVEAGDHIEGRLLAAKGTDEAGGRVFGVRILAYGDSKNGRRYTETVMRRAIPLYEGAKAYDGHRSEAELRSSSITGLVGYYSAVHATDAGLEADLHLLPSAKHTAEALDAALAVAEATGQRGMASPLVGISHDVQARYRTVVDGGRQLQEATEIVKVNSADVVADPAAGGLITRMVAGGTDPTPTTSAPAANPAGGTDPAGEAPAATDAGEQPASSKEASVPDAPAASAPAAPATPTYNLEQVLALLRSASPQQLAEATGLATVTTGVLPSDNNPVVTRKDGFFGRQMIETKILDAGLPLPTVEAVYRALPDRITEADVDAHIVAIKASLGVLEKANLAPKAGVKVTKEALDKKQEALDAFFAGDHVKGYHSIKQAYADFTGLRPSEDHFGQDWNRRILQESMGAGFDSATRSFESLDATSWNLVLGDSITRRMVAEYSQPNLQTWRQIVSSIVPVNDFRQQRVDRIGGYGTLPGVNQGAPYQPLTSPPNEEVTYTITKRGGTEDITLEMIANDDVRAIQRIPVKLGLAAAQTLYRFVWDILNPTSGGANPLIYDGVALYAAGHGNTAASALSGSTLSTIRQKMRAQTAYGDAQDVLGYIPRTLIVVNALEELGYELVTSTVALPSGAPVGAASNIPNIHQGTQLIVVDYWSGTTGWMVVADTGLCPTLELGFYQGRDTPELFTQSDPNYGTVFNADKVSYKIRHVYSGAVLDYRGFQRGNS